MTRFGPYRLCETLGVGGMAVVQRAVLEGSHGFEREVVVKRIRQEHARDDSFVSLFASEARLGALLRHPAIVQVHDFGEIAGEHYAELELIEGVDLYKVIRAARDAARPLDAALVCWVIAEVADALAYVHGASDERGRPLGIVHRDVSPSNVMLTAAGAVKLLDFGIATSRGAGDPLSGSLSGKLGYMSPEQASGLPADHRSDLFSLGVVFHECLTLRRLYRGEGDLETLRLVREVPATPPSLSAPHVPPAIDAVVMRMLAPSPEQRYQSASEVVQALAPIVERRHGQAAAIRQLLAAMGPVVADEHDTELDFTEEMPACDYGLRGRRTP